MIRAVRARIAPVIAFLVVWSPQVALACSVCSSGKEDANRIAFAVTAAVLSVLPLAMVGGLVWWLRRRSRELNGDVGAESVTARASSPL